MMLEIKNVVAGYLPDVNVLQGIDIHVKKGELVCMIGPNGAGKSTVLRTISGILNPTQGEILFDGKNIAGLRPDLVLRQGIAHVPQGHSSFPEMTVQEALDTLRDVVGPRIRESMPEDMSLAYRGTADRLESAFDTMTINLAIAAIILCLVLAAMFRSFWDAAIVMLSMPPAIAGGVLALRALNLFTTQAMDLLTTIGFLIVLGLVVNNAILLVMQTRTGLRKGLDRATAVAEAVRVRARPIYMSTLTSIFGMLPLMLIPGVGSQIYRGLATVIIGGMFVSAVFTLVLMPSVMRLPPVANPLRRRAASIKGVTADA